MAPDFTLGPAVGFPERKCRFLGARLFSGYDDPTGSQLTTSASEQTVLAFHLDGQEEVTRWRQMARES